MSASNVLRSAVTAAGRQTPHQVRHLHITLPAPSPHPLLISGSVAAFYLPRSHAELKQECVIRNLKSSGTKNELVTRLSADDVHHSRSFATNARPSATGTAPFQPTNVSPSAAPNRTFNTTRALKANHDTSTIDFAYLPSFLESSSTPFTPLKGPFLPDNYRTQNTLSAHDADEEVTALRPNIYTASDSSTHIQTPSAMSEVHDNSSMTIDPFELTSKVQYAANKVGAGVVKETSALREVLEGMLDDMFGKKGGKLA